MSYENELLPRIERLESQIFKIKLTGILFVILIAGFAAKSLITKGPLTVTGLSLADSQGRIVGKLGTSSLAGTCLELMGSANVASVELCAGDDSGSALTLFTDHGKTRAFLSAGSVLLEGGGRLAPSLVIAEADGKNLVSAMVGTETRLIVGHGTGEASAVVSVSGSKAAIRMVDASGKTSWSSP
jgi:hypothetical protein